MTQPYYADDTVTLYHGDCRIIAYNLRLTADLIVTDPPYGETSLAWDRWPDRWPATAAAASSSMWCFGSMRMFLERRDEFAGWRLSQDLVWEKHNGSGFAADRFKRVHELILHWYSGAWTDLHFDPIRVAYTGPDKHVRSRKAQPGHTGTIGAYFYDDDGTRLARTVLRAPATRGGLHPTEKPIGILDPLIRYGCPPGGTVLDMFAGSGSTLDAARQVGRHAIGIELDERYCELAARRLAQGVLTAPWHSPPDRGPLVLRPGIGDGVRGAT